MIKPQQKRLFDLNDAMVSKNKGVNKSNAKNYDSIKSKRNNNNDEQPISKNTKTNTNKKHKKEESDVVWKDFKISKPDPHIPCNFKIETGKKTHTFRGYVESAGITCTDDPYAMSVLRKKYDNLYYSEISGCRIEDCPDGFPRCETCTKRKNK